MTASPMPFSSGSWDLYAETFGDPGDPAVVFLHGAGNSMMAFDAELCEALAARGRLVVRLDARDVGRSARSGPSGPDYTLHDLASDVVALLDALDVPAATLAGVSQGGMVAQIVAVEHPRRVSALVLISTTTFDDGLPGPVEGLFADTPPQPDLSDRAAAVRWLVALERPYGASRFDEELVTRMAERSVDHARDLAAQLSHPFEVGQGRPVRDRLHEIRVPTVVVHGTEDPMFPLAHGQALAAAIPGARLMALEGFGHAHVPRADWPALLDVLSSLPTPPPSAGGPAPRA
jgi:pimeloyl-ACP methyl ester carboxylesterase